MLKITPTRAALLRLLAKHPGGYYVSGLADEIAPRKHGWSAQGAARWGGGYVKPLEQAGLVEVNRFVSAGVGMASITAAGRAALVRYNAGA